MPTTTSTHPNTQATSWTGADRTHRQFALGEDFDPSDEAADLLSAQTTVVVECGGALAGEGIFVEGLASTNTVVSALRVSQIQGTPGVSAENIAAAAALTTDTITFTGEAFQADDFLVLVYV